METISSTQNPAIKQLLKLEKPRARKESGLCVIEGYREIARALSSGYSFDSLFYCPEIANFSFDQMVKDFPADKKISVNSHVFSRIAYRDSHQGLVATARMKDHGIGEFRAVPGALYLVVEKVEKPGNLGALLRTSDAAGVDAVFICDNQTDIYNPNVIRSSLGCLFSNKIILAASEEVISFLKSSRTQILAAALQDSEVYTGVDFRRSSAIVMGAESEGLSETWRKAADKIIRIPMAGMADSLNVSVSAAILIFEAVRQRKP